MPIYNVAPYVERALLSALNQTFESIEFLIVDDKGTDNSMDIVRRIISEHPRGKDVRIIEHEKNIGLGAARNTAIDNAKGEYLFFMDSDDAITLDCIAILYNAIIEESVDFVVGSHNCISENRITKEEIHQVQIIKGQYSLLEYVYKYGGLINMSTWNKLYLLSFLKKNHIKCIPYHVVEDQLFSFNVYSKAVSVRLLSNITYHYYINEKSTLNRIKDNGLSKRDIQTWIDIYNFKKDILCMLNRSDIYNCLLGKIVLENISHVIRINLISDFSNKYYYMHVLLDFRSVDTQKVKKQYLRVFFHMPHCLKLMVVNVLSVLYRNYWTKKGFVNIIDSN